MIQLERQFLWRFKTDSRHIPYWAMLEIQIDLYKEYDIIVHARSTVALRRTANKGQHYFVLQDIKCCEELEYFLQQCKHKPMPKKTKD